MSKVLQHEVTMDTELAVADEEVGTITEPTETEAAKTDNVEKPILKIPALTVIYWCEKMTATTFGETFADYFSQTLGLGYTSTSLVLLSIFFVTLVFQLKVRTYWPGLFWMVMATSSIAGTCISDFIDRTLGWGYPLGMSVLLSIVLAIMAVWKLSGEPMNVEGAMNRKAEAMYWSTILVSNTLGTALGDFLADSAGWGFGPTAGCIGGLLLVCAGLAYWTKVSHVLLFWVAFVLTRPFGASFGDLLTKGSEEGGLDLGTLNASLVIAAFFFLFFGIEMYQRYKVKKLEEEKTEVDKTAESQLDEDA